MSEVPSEPVTDEQKLAMLHSQVLTLQDAVDKLTAAGESALLDDNAKHRGLLIDEIRQRIRMRRWIAIFSIIVIIAMAAFATHSVHEYFWGHFVFIPSSLAIALFFAPIVSITTITIMLLIGAFRRFKDEDMDRVDMKALAEAAFKIGSAGSH